MGYLMLKLWNKLFRRKVVKYQLIIGGQVSTVFETKTIPEILARMCGGIVVPIEVDIDE